MSTSTKSSKTTSRVQSTPSASTSATVHPTAPITMPPTTLAHAPPVPAGAPTLAKGEARTLKKLTKAQAPMLTQLASDFQASTTWEQDFGAHAPSQATMVQLVQGTNAILTESVNAKNWDTYVHALQMLCGDSLVTLLETLVAMFQLGVAQNPGLTTTYPTLAAYAAARQPAIKKAVATRKKRKSAAAAPVGAATATATAPAAAAPVAANAPAPAPVAPAAATPAAAGSSQA